MVKYNELRIEDQELYLDVEIEDKSYFENITITGARIDTPLTYGTNTPYHPIEGDNTSKLTAEISLPAAKNDLLLITLQIEGAPAPDTPCGQDVPKVGVIYNKKSVMQKGLNYLKELSTSCIIPKGFIDFILKLKALDMAIETCNYTEAIKYWGYINKVTTVTINTKCGCNGFN